MSFENGQDEIQDEQGSEFLAPFTLDDAEEELRACALCEHKPNCAIIAFVNKLSIKRDNRVADDEFSCVIFKEVTA